MERIALIILLAFILDTILGDPQNKYHPIRIIGNYIFFWILKFKNKKNKSNRSSFILGSLLSLSTIFFTFITTFSIVYFGNKINSSLGFILEVILCYFIIAPKSLKIESMKVNESILSKNLDEARFRLSYIVGRDTNELTLQQITVATVETIAENLSDGVIAPILFVFIGGVPLGMAYKAINTLDSMIGYRNETYEYFGKFAAILDDIVNFIPARISAIFVMLATVFTRNNTKNSINIYLRDRKNHKSPNSAQTESVYAGALGIQLGGDNYYHGVLVHKPTIGEYIEQPTSKHIEESNKLMYVTTTLVIITMIIVSILLGGTYV